VVAYSLRITPHLVTLTPGATQQFTVVATDALGNNLSMTPTYQATGGSIASTGLYHAGSVAGQFKVVATMAGGFADVALVTIGNPPPPDRVTLHLSATSAAQLPVMLLDVNEGGASGCRNDQHYTGDAIFPNWLAHGPCGPDEIAAFARGAAAVIYDGPGNSGQVWTDAPGESQVVDLQAGVRVAPVELWIVDQLYQVEDEHGHQTDAPVEAEATHMIDHANTWYDASRAGIRFDYGTPHQAWNNAAVKAALGCFPNGPDLVCQCTPGLYTSAGAFVPGKLNVYFVDQALYDGSYAMGVNCRDPHSTSNPAQAGNAILIGTKRMSLATVAHELGHALSLGHTGEGGGSVYHDPITGDPLFDATNLMWSGVEDAFTFSLGQAFRMNVETMSQLNANGVRTGPTRACECRASSPTCDYVAASNTDGVCPRVSRPW
jgi:hypothetical protein